MKTQTHTIEKKKSWWDTVTEYADDAVNFVQNDLVDCTKETLSVAWDLAKENPVSTILLAGSGFCVAAKAWPHALVLAALGTAGVAINEMEKILHKEQMKRTFIMTWKMMNNEQRRQFVRMAKPDLTEEQIDQVVRVFNESFTV